MKRLNLLCLLVVCLVMTASSVEAGQSVSAAVPIQVSLKGGVETSGCENSPGPEVTLSGALTLGGIGLDLIFRNNEKGTHTATEEARVDAVLLPAGQSISIPKQPVLGGVGGNPFMWVQLVNGAGEALSGSIFLGRCVQGVTPIFAEFLLPGTAVADVSAEGCTNNPGPYITLSGQVALSGVNARFTFSNNDNPVGGPHSADETTTADVIVIPAGQAILIPKQPVLGGVGGNPWISVLFRDSFGEAVGREFLLGRCVQISK
jgi:hypothetical protein